MPTGSVTSIAASSAACGGRTIAPNWGGTRRAEYGTPRSLQQIWPPPALYARILESPLDRHELVHEDRSGGDCAGIVEEAEGSKHHLRQYVDRARQVDQSPDHRDQPARRDAVAPHYEPDEGHPEQREDTEQHQHQSQQVGHVHGIHCASWSWRARSSKLGRTGVPFPMIGSRSTAFAPCSLPICQWPGRDAPHAPMWTCAESA